MSVEDDFAAIAAHTALQCGQCRAPHACCNSMQCEDTRAYALSQGVVLEDTGHARLPFMGETGCVVAPHLRPICAVHVCEQHFKGDAWEDTYWELRERASISMENAQ